MHEALNHAKLAMLFRKEFELCNVQKGETIVLLSDLGARRDYVSAAFAAAEDFGADVYEMCVNAMPSWTKVGVETVGRCKGTLDAIKAADMLVCLHIPLFTRWLKEARDAGTRVLMVIDGPDELEELMAPPGLKEAVIYAGSAARARQDHAHHAAGRHRPHGAARRISDHDPVRLFGIEGPLRPLGRGPRPHLPERRHGQRHRRVRAGRHRRAALLPLRAGRGAARHPRRLHPKNRGRPRRQADERLARRQQGASRRHGRPRHLASRLGPQSARPLGRASRSTAPIRSAITPARAALPATSCSPPARTRRAAASAPPRATTTCRCATARSRSTTTSSSSAANSPTTRCRYARAR